MKPEIPDDAMARIAPILAALEEAFRPLADTLAFDEEPAVVPEEGE